jgi:hypothetical protein
MPEKRENPDSSGKDWPITPLKLLLEFNEVEAPPDFDPASLN